MNVSFPLVKINWNLVARIILFSVMAACGKLETKGFKEKVKPRGPASEIPSMPAYFATQSAAVFSTSPKIAVGGIISNCRSGSHSVDGISGVCGNYPASTAYETVPGEVIEIYGENLLPQDDETLYVLFYQVNESRYGQFKIASYENNHILYVANNQINVKVPAGLRAGMSFVNLQYSSRGISNSDVVKILGPEISSNHVSVPQTDSKLQFRANSLASIAGKFSPTLNRIFLTCDGRSRQEVPVHANSVSKIDFIIPADFPANLRCAITVNTGSIESSPVYFITDAAQKYQDSIGIYHWDTEVRGKTGAGESNLNYAAEKAAQLGFKTLRIYVGNNSQCAAYNGYDYTPSANCVRKNTLKEMVQREDYQKLLSNPDISTFYLTSYSIVNSNLSNGASWADEAGFAANKVREYNEFREYAQYLGHTYPNKQFVIMDWEGDNATTYYIGGLSNLQNYSFDDITRIYTRYADWIINRADAVHAADVSNVKIGTEFSWSWRSVMNQWYSVVSAADCSITNNMRHSVLTHVMPKVYNSIDVISFSSYNSLGNTKYDPLTLVFGTGCQVPAQSPQSPVLSNNYDVYKQLSMTIDYVRNNFPNKEIIVGEFGFVESGFVNADTIDGKTGSDALRAAVIKAIDAALGAGATKVISWQLFDNPGTTDFGVYDKNGNPTMGGKLKALYSAGLFKSSLKERMIKSANGPAQPWDVWNWYFGELTGISGRDPVLAGFTGNRGNAISYDEWMKYTCSNLTWAKNVGLDCEVPAGTVTPSAQQQFIDSVVASAGGAKAGLNFWQWNWYFERAFNKSAPSPEDCGSNFNEAVQGMSVEQWLVLLKRNPSYLHSNGFGFLVQ